MDQLATVITSYQTDAIAAGVAMATLAIGLAVIRLIRNRV